MNTLWTSAKKKYNMYQTEVTELKNTLTRLKNTLERSNGRLDEAEKD